LPRFVRSYRLAVRHCRGVIDRLGPAAVLATGGFVSAPAVEAAADADVPVALVNLDAVPGRANRWSARRATEVFTAYAPDGGRTLPRAQRIGVPLREQAARRVDPGRARFELGLRPDLDTVLITAGSQGASTLNEMMIELLSRSAQRRVFNKWQVFHLAGEAQRDRVAEAYDKAGVEAVVEPFCDAMGLAWSSATLAVSRAGAGSVAEVWHHAVPTIFVPYPYHRDQHQRKNAEPLVTAGGAMLVVDRIEPADNVAEVAGPLTALMTGEARREKMRRAADVTRPPDGADAVAKWLISVGATA
jgi:UDP-N-acetylglucosamine--N-acetylmuramyl-(pentapeptide) pyrophosphoryl-undecaprenol N-acetylglucosamine transferase